MIGKIKKLYSKLGPGVITGASDDDPSGIATYSQAGAQAGFGMLWTALLTFPLMAAIQEMCARIGIVTGHGLTGNLRNHFPIWVLYPIAFLVVFANVINIGANIAGMAASANLLLPLPRFIWAVLFTSLIILLMVFASYATIARYLKWFAFALFTYFAVPFVIGVDWYEVFIHTIVPSVELNHNTIALFVAILGTTISPYLFFWQTSMEVENKMEEMKSKVTNKWIVTKHELRLMGKDVTLGMFLSNITMWFIIITTAVTLAPLGITEIESAEQAASALKPIAGDFAYLLFAAGIIGTGFLAIPVLAGSASYVLSEVFGWREGLDLPFNKARQFYIVIILATLVGLAINFLGLNPFRMLIYTAIIYGVMSPALILVILILANNKKVMGEHTNNFVTNVLGTTTFVVMTTAAVAFLFTLR
ncbi:MAG: divalent metal cation transporter [Candidatus Curtissbacteria bacterium]|nr:divalent metal cation transporter [Candidatus Curtissbacteria bacterium]